MINDSVEYQLGKLVAAVESHSKRMEDVIVKIDDSEKRRSEDFAKLTEHTKIIDENVREISKLRKDIEDVKPVVAEVRRWKTMGLGALGVVGFAMAALGASMQDIIAWVVKFFKGS
jgi:hypothetical protein